MLDNVFVFFSRKKLSYIVNHETFSLTKIKCNPYLLWCVVASKINNYAEGVMHIVAHVENIGID